MISGVVFLDKPEGQTSRQAVDSIRKIYSPLLALATGKRRIRLKAGHAGTLDPLATGMLPILLGEATRFADMGLQADKCYDVTIDLSLQTNTLDREGELEQRYHQRVTLDQIMPVLDHWHGEQQQRPPHFSAIHIDGKRAYTLARKGIVADMPLRKIHIHAIECLHFDFPMLHLRVRCAKGTYIRSLARDIGIDLGVGGCVHSLRRITTGAWSENFMQSLTSIIKNPDVALYPTEEWLRGWPDVSLDEDLGKRFVQGQRLPMDKQATGQVCVLFDGMLLGMGIIEERGDHVVLQPKNVLPSVQSFFVSRL
ncbi:MAG: tRNA pseudouridine(55) synthase TruB [Mariprofundaceae bacterium]|nr:tRNA pseudouridine(55) synthase TruB [Mariprofundaceae bacterium]